MILKSMKIGDKGANVTKAQKLLQKTGSTIKVTGVYNIGMVSAVRAFQKKNGLKVTGVLDPKTFAKLEAVAAKKIVKMVPKKK
jgi:N-acetylmuramoyl-L-alanine amidase